jgi:hypothetical protein
MAKTDLAPRNRYQSGIASIGVNVTVDIAVDPAVYSGAIQPFGNVVTFWFEYAIYEVLPALEGDEMLKDGHVVNSSFVFVGVIVM